MYRHFEKSDPKCCLYRVNKNFGLPTLNGYFSLTGVSHFFQKIQGSGYLRYKQTASFIKTRLQKADFITQTGERLTKRKMDHGQ